MWRKFLNPFMIWLLRSPFHFFVSKQIMLISVKGRKSGKIYTTPVEYGMDGQAVYTVTSMSYSWWKNLRDGGIAHLVIKGQPVDGKAQLAEDNQAILNAFRIMYPNRSGFERVAAGCIAIRIDLATGGTSGL